jgi:hypothetical protein
MGRTSGAPKAEACESKAKRMTNFAAEWDPEIAPQPIRLMGVVSFIFRLVVVEKRQGEEEEEEEEEEELYLRLERKV